MARVGAVVLVLGLLVYLGTEPVARLCANYNQLTPNQPIDGVETTPTLTNDDTKQGSCIPWEEELATANAQPQTAADLEWVDVETCD